MHKSFQKSFLVLAVGFIIPGLAAAGVNDERRAVVFYTAETRGTLEPCGCTSDPLGDFARVSALVRIAAGRSQSALLVDAGSLAYPRDVADSLKKHPAAELRAEFLRYRKRQLVVRQSHRPSRDLVS